MLKQSEKLFMFNPFALKEWSNEDIKEQIDILIGKYNPDADIMMDMALNVENLSNQMYLIGEMIARITESYNVLKAELENETNQHIYIERNDYEKKHDGKVPAISYFQAIAYSKTKDKRLKVASLEADLKRFKVAYESVEAKMQAVKKKMEAYKFELSGEM